jgi:hypothetical protein
MIGVCNSHDEFELPPIIRELVEAHKAVVRHYELSRRTFTLDGKLIGDIGEAVASELFDIELSLGNDPGIDAYSIDGRSIQIKATASGGNPMFRPIEKRADHFIFLSLDLKSGCGKIIYNGPENLVLREMPKRWHDQRGVSKRALRKATLDQPPGSCLPRRGSEPRS